MTQRIEGMQRRQEIKRGIIDILTHIFIPDITLEGGQNLQEVRRLALQRNPAKPIIFVPNHLSNADAPAITHALSRHGFKDIANNLVFLLGMKLKQNPLTNPFTDSFSIITVWPPSLEPKNKKENKKRTTTHKKSLLATKEALDNGHHLVIFPETTRSRTGNLIEGQPVIMHYIPDNALIVPVGIRGTEHVLKPGTLIPRRFPITVAFGPPIDMQNVMVEKEIKLTNSQRRAKAMNQIMRAIASILPEQYRGVYA